MSNLRVDDVVKVSHSSLYDNLAGAIGIILQVTKDGYCLVDFEDDYIVPDDTELLIGSSFYLPEDSLYLYRDSQQEYIEKLEDKINQLEDQLTSSRVCLIMSENIRQEQYNEIVRLESELNFSKSTK